MPSIATEAAPRREHLLTTLRAGDTYGFLGRAEAYLQANPDDAEVCASVVRAYAALGLSSAIETRSIIIWGAPTVIATSSPTVRTGKVNSSI